MNIEDGLELMGVVGEHVGTIGVLGALIQVVVLLDELLQLGLNIGHLVCWNLVLIQGYSSFLQKRIASSMKRMEIVASIWSPERWNCF